MKILSLSTALSLLFTLASALSFAAEKHPDLIIYFDYEDFQGNAVKDKSGRGHDGVINGDVKQVDAPDRGGKVAKFAAGSFLDLDGPNIPDGDIPVDGMSVLAWINVEAISDMAIFNARAGDATWLVHPEARGDGNYRWLLRGPGGATIFDIRAGQNRTNEWVHFAGAYDRQRTPGAILFINGEAVGEANGNLKIAPDWDMGARVGFNIDNARPFTGMMDELNVWKRGLSKEEVQAIMNDGVEDFLAVEAKDKLATKWGRIKAQR
jgi:hypothetical protein